MSDPTTALKGLVVQTTGTNAGTWGSVLNTGCISLLDTMLAGVVSLSLASTDVSLSASNVQNASIALTGALLADIAITADVGALFNGFYFIDNRTTGAFKVSISNGVGNALLIPQGTSRQVFSDQTYGIRSVGLAPPGTFADYGGATVHPSLLATSTLVGEYLLCSGAPFSRTGITANLFAAIGTAWGIGDGSTTAATPDLRGRGRYGKDDMGGSAANRLTTAGSGVNGLTVGATGGAQNVSIAQANIPLYNLTVTDPGHVHAMGLSAGSSNTNPGSTPIPGDTGANTQPAFTGITVSSGGSGTALQTMNPAAVVNVLIKI